MPYKIHCTAANEKSLSPVFKLRRSWGAIKCAQDGFENDSIAFSDVDQTFRDEGAPLHTPELTMQEGDSSDTVSHPWEVVDYHLYLCSVEGGQDTHARRNGVFVYDGIDCHPVYYSELLEERAFEPCNVGEEPQFLFWDLPIADLGPSFNGRHYVLGFDYNNRTLFARHFDWIPHKTDDLWCVWDLGFTMYSVTIPDLIILLESGLSEDVHIGLGLLSSSPYCIAMGSSDDPGMEIVITILFCQWVLDFAEAIFEQDGNVMEIFKERLTHYMEECRIILARASYRAWFASQDGYTKAAYQRNSSIDRFTNDQAWRLATCSATRTGFREERRRSND
ncbi:hypothetical protein BDV28DRAFT_130982 [Aspergillus coremiiformis]|uniref:Uncharacterized protein n=1 Tax=Aspergillus coremiiformis TaxID=138285 RepID=A0A5N6ZEF0_9EURO|nr:hypothetical protein BDV28DRAFT_130982 [Aspergillus coremiiformis]